MEFPKLLGVDSPIPWAGVDRLSLLVDRSIEVMPFASNGNVRLIGAPGSTDRPTETVPALLIFRHVPGYP